MLKISKTALFCALFITSWSTYGLGANNDSGDGVTDHCKVQITKKMKKVTKRIKLDGKNGVAKIKDESKIRFETIWVGNWKTTLVMADLDFEEHPQVNRSILMSMIAYPTIFDLEANPGFAKYFPYQFESSAMNCHIEKERMMIQQIATSEANAKFNEMVRRNPKGANAIDSYTKATNLVNIVRCTNRLRDESHDDDLSVLKAKGELLKTCLSSVDQMIGLGFSVGEVFTPVCRKMSKDLEGKPQSKEAKDLQFKSCLENVKKSIDQEGVRASAVFKSFFRDSQ